MSRPTVLLLALLLVGCMGRARTPAPDAELAAPDAELAAPDPELAAPGHEPGASDPDTAAAQARAARAWAAQPCAACHGLEAQGAVGPALAATPLDAASFRAVLREGRSPMPAFGPDQLDDEQVEELHAWLTALPAPEPTSEPAVATVSDAVLPPGVYLERFAEGLPYPVALAWGPPPRAARRSATEALPDSVLYVATNGRAFPLPEERAGAIYWLEPSSGTPSDPASRSGLESAPQTMDEPAMSTPRLFARDIDRPLGLQFVDTGAGAGPELYVSARGRVSVWADEDGDGLADEIRSVVDDLPAFGLHQNNGLALGPDGRLYLGMGSASNADLSDDPMDGSILRFRPDGRDLEVHATGLRNAFGLAFGPGGALFATDNGVDPPLRQDAPEELNHVVEGGDYGHPRVFGVETPPAGSPAIMPIATFPSHASANGLLFPSGAMFPELEGHLLVAEFGSYLEGYEDRGRRLLLVALDNDGESFRAYPQPWIEAFPGRPLALAEGPEGAVYIADFESDAVWRVWRR